MRNPLRRTGAPEPLLLDYEPHPIRLDPSAKKRRRSVAKEPYTVAWLETSLRPGDVLYDVGANVGAYSLVAAVAQPEATVVAFEPGFENFASLCRNLALNRLDRVVPLQVALGRSSELVHFHYRRIAPGNAQHHVGDGAPFASEFAQAVIGVRLDDLVELLGLPPATHLKLDVDGAELDVIAGADAVLRGASLRELQVEVEPGDERVEKALAPYGFHVTERHETPKVVNARFARA